MCHLWLCQELRYFRNFSGSYNFQHLSFEHKVILLLSIKQLLHLKSFATFTRCFHTTQRRKKGVFRCSFTKTITLDKTIAYCNLAIDVTWQHFLQLVIVGFRRSPWTACASPPGPTRRNSAQLKLEHGAEPFRQRKDVFSESLQHEEWFNIYLLNFIKTCRLNITQNQVNIELLSPVVPKSPHFQGLRSPNIQGEVQPRMKTIVAWLSRSEETNWQTLLHPFQL